MREAVLVAAARTAVGKAPKGALRHTRPEDLGAAVITEVIKRAPGLAPEMLDDVIIGCAMPEGEQGFNMARIISVYAGLPTTVPGFTINRFCSSGLQSIAIAAEKIMCGFADVVLAGGVESMSYVPMVGNKPSPHPDIVDLYPDVYISMGHTAENVAARFEVSREEQDRFAFESHRKAAAAIAAGKFKDEIVPLTIKEKHLDDRGKLHITEKVFDTDEGVRPETTTEGLSRLKSPFRVGGSVTAGNSSQTSDGAAAVIVMSREKANELGLKPLAIFRSFVVGGVDPDVMGIGPVVAIPKALKLASITQDDVDLFEINEAFASQAAYVVRHLGIDPDKVNVNGGAIALGHPLGCSGAKLTVTLLHEAARRGARYGVVSMCIGGGQGAAGVFEFVK
ncbi:acetyl-CoA acyltransferase [Aneurinibacillus soli]|uniref:acetyl-CoA C-acyltransferase n=1 Tax=Aneurinibacillus soli TaxID=1500254 RepID=A0A0U5BAK8_9BACL|nr:acetyl-CoA C-acyltransferase [Aneurinibacillus soli]PYE63983.1 acetyl-CoA acyltransferase [Aneurinibacillus soli]BAU27932.1 3-ketoacyl-CoA thiolase [Aneurinibacillus soli]